MDSLLGSPASLPGSLEAQLAQLGAGPAPRAPSAGLYDAYCPSPMPQLGPRLPSPAAPFAPQAAPRAYSPNQPGFGPAGGLPLEAQLQQFNAAQQALLAQRLQLQQAVSGGMQGYGGGGLPQYAPQQMHFQQGFNSMHQPIPSPPMPAPQLFAQQPQQVQPPAAAGGWGLAGQQPMRGMGAPLMGAPAPRSASGSGSPQEGAQHPHISLDEALAALSKLKAAQQQQQQGLPGESRAGGELRGGAHALLAGRAHACGPGACASLPRLTCDLHLTQPSPASPPPPCRRAAHARRAALGRDPGWPGLHLHLLQLAHPQQQPQPGLLPALHRARPAGRQRAQQPGAAGAARQPVGARAGAAPRAVSPLRQSRRQVGASPALGYPPPP